MRRKLVVLLIAAASAATAVAGAVSNFRRSNLLYGIAMRWNRDLDRDGDKIACEKH
jgi:Excalibur calcium-binding domain